MKEPLSAVAARDLARKILEEGETIYSKHAREQLEARQMTEQDVTNTIRGGHVKPKKGITFENGTWRYTIETARFAVVVAFPSETRLRVVTVWRVEP